MRPMSVTNRPKDRVAGASRSDAGARPPVPTIGDDVIFASLSTQIAVLDSGGTVIRVNDAWRSNPLDGSIAEDRSIVGRNYLDECRRAERRGAQAARDLRQGIEGVLTRRAKTFRCEFSPRATDHRYEVIVDMLRHEGGGAVVSFADVTGRRLDDENAEATRQHVAHLGNAAMMAEIASALACEIKQPVAAIRLNALAGATLLGSPHAGLEAAWSDSREAWQMFKDIYDDASRASGVVEHVHQHVRRQGAQGGMVDIGETCRTTASLVEHEAVLRGARIELQIDPATPAIVGDGIEFQQIVMSLLLNALDAVATSSERVITLGTVTHGAEVELFVRDTGAGLSPTARQHLFESFFTTKEGGLGMGLIIVRSIVERHRGRVSGENALDGKPGAIFRVHLPVT
jgi:C4-dicarboxylate-specific signal transduction histidine kinase